MRLGDLISTLETLPKDAPVEFDFGVPAGRLMSWRGVYAELTLTWAGGLGWKRDPEVATTVGSLLDDAREALDGKVFEGYKGGCYTMNEHTPVWADDYGACNHHGLMGARIEGDKAVLVTADLSDYRGW